MSRQFTSLLCLPITAAAALGANLFITGAGALPAAGAGVRGVTRSAAAAAGDVVPVDVMGTAVITASAAITKDALVETTVAGKAVTKSTGIAVGVALEAATGDGDLIEIGLIPFTA